MSGADLLLRPESAPLLLLAPLAWVVLLLGDRRMALRAREFLGERSAALAPRFSRRRRTGRRTIFAGGLLLALLAALGPTWGENTRTVQQRGVDLLVCLDVSRSMLSRDISPSRLERARREIRALAERVRGDRIGLVTFAGEARLAVPLTADMETLADLAGRAGTLDVARGGTDLGTALDAALSALGAAGGDHEAILLLTDGEDHEERGLRAAVRCRDRGITVHCVSLGSARGGKIPVPAQGGERFLTDRDGRDVVSIPDREGLRRIAETTGGEFVEAESHESVERVLPALYAQRILPMARKALESEQRRERENRFQWLLAPAFALLLLDLLLTDGRR